MRAGAGAQVERGNLGVQAVGKPGFPIPNSCSPLNLHPHWDILKLFTRKGKMLFLDTFYE